jgi:hypothetical protein
MATYLHLWIGNPESASKMTQLNGALRDGVRSNGEFAVVYEKNLLDISDLADSFTSSSEVKEAIEDAARKFGMERAYAMYGVEDSIREHSSPHPKLKYLGSFEFEEGEG